MIESQPLVFEPFGQALLAYWRGNESAQLIQEFRSGRKKTVPVSVFFRTPGNLFPTEKVFPYCRARILVVGAGSGVHALELERMGFDVTAIDICFQAVSIMQERGLKDVRHKDFFQLEKELYDTIVMLGYNIGIAETVENLICLFRKCELLLKPDGQLLANSVTELDGRSSWNHGAYPGNLEFRLRYEDIHGPWMRWLHIDYDSLATHALQNCWSIRKLTATADGAFLARLRP